MPSVVSNQASTASAASGPSVDVGAIIEGSHFGLFHVAILLNTCTICHDLQRVRTRRATPEGWKELLEEMIFEGAPLSDDNIPILLTYLARNFRPGQ